MRARREATVSGGDFEEATPDPIPNSEVKLFGADGTAGGTLWESRTSPGLFIKAPIAVAVGALPFCAFASEDCLRNFRRGLQNCFVDSEQSSPNRPFEPGGDCPEVSS